jgi:hypothetical protein
VKLYCVTYTVRSYVLADDKREAARLGKEELENVNANNCSEVEEVRPDSVRASGWDDRCLVYTRDRKAQISLADAWPKEEPSRDNAVVDFIERCRTAPVCPVEAVRYLIEHDCVPPFSRQDPCALDGSHLAGEGYFVVPQRGVEVRSTIVRSAIVCASCAGKILDAWPKGRSLHDEIRDVAKVVRKVRA